jgi:hypothetical protein
MQIGQKKESDFSEPIGMLEDCHKRILYFLKTLVTLADIGRERPLSPDQRISLENALRYFRESAPNHTADEEGSLFPRLRRSGAPQVREIFSKLDSLELDHRQADDQHQQVETICRQWLLSRRSELWGRRWQNAAGSCWEIRLRMRSDISSVEYVPRKIFAALPQRSNVSEDSSGRSGFAWFAL